MKKLTHILYKQSHQRMHCFARIVNETKAVLKENRYKQKEITTIVIRSSMHLNIYIVHDKLHGSTKEKSLPELVKGCYILAIFCF